MGFIGYTSAAYGDIAKGANNTSAKADNER